MSIYDEISEQIKVAMRAKDKARLSTLRSIRSQFIVEKKKNNAETLSDEACCAAMTRLAKQRRDSIAAYSQAGREDLADVERAELAVIDAFLPSLADTETTTTWVQEAIAQCGADQVGHVGKVMGTLMRSHRGDVDGGLAKKIAAQLLSD